MSRVLHVGYRRVPVPPTTARANNHNYNHHSHSHPDPNHHNHHNHREIYFAQLSCRFEGLDSGTP